MLAKKVPDVSGLLDPAAKAWKKVDREVVDLFGMPIHVQTSRYVRTVWADRLIGKVRAVSVRAVHDGERVAVQMEWNDDSQNTEFADRKFPDGAAVAFPSNGDAPFTTLGAADAPVNLWRWRADLSDGENLVAHGLGTDRKAEDTAGVASQAKWEEGRWTVVFTRPLKAKGAENAKFSAGKATKIGFTIWEGENQERGDLRSYSRQWRDLVLEA